MARLAPFAQQLRQNSHLLLCPPDAYRLADPDPVYGHANDMTAASYEAFLKDTALFQQHAHTQWKTLYAIIQDLKIQNTLLHPQPDLLDQVFTADASLSFVHGEKSFVLASQFSLTRRQGEVNPHLEVIQKIDPQRLCIHGEFPSEGSGDNLYDPFRDVFFSGFCSNLSPTHKASGRSDKRAHQTLERISGIRVIGLELERPFFHLDTTFMPLISGHIIVYPGGLKSESYSKLLQAAFHDFGLSPTDYLIEVSREEALQYACNSVNLGDLIIMAHVKGPLKDRLQSLGYQISMVDLSSFIAAGGGPHCLTNNITTSRIPGGLIQHSPSCTRKNTNWN